MRASQVQIGGVFAELVGSGTPCPGSLEPHTLRARARS